MLSLKKAAAREEESDSMNVAVERMKGKENNT